MAMTTERIEINPAIMMGKPVIRGTRITVELILRKLAEGASEGELLEDYPHLTTEDIRAAVAYGAASVAHEEVVFLPDAPNPGKSWSMNFLADESCAGPVLRALREAGHDVVAIAEVARGATDEQVLERALGHVPHLRCSASYIPRTQRLRAGLKYAAPTVLEETQILPSHPSAYALG